MNGRSRDPRLDSLQRLSLREALLEAPAAASASPRAVSASPRAVSVLEVGCGDGRFLSAMASSLPQARLVGMDVSGRAIKKASLRLDGDPRATFLEAPVEAIPWEADSFDLVVTIRSFHHWRDHQSGLREIQRVLRAGGTLVIGDALATGWIRRPWLRRMVEMLDGGRFTDPRTFDAMLAGSGFEVLRRIPLRRSAGALFVTVARA